MAPNFEFKIPVSPPVKSKKNKLTDASKPGVSSSKIQSEVLQSSNLSISSGYSYDRNQENSPMLKLTFPNLLRTERNNTRALDGPITTPKNPEELLDEVVDVFESIFKEWNMSLIPKTMKASKQTVCRSEPLLVGDIVYFKKVENNISSSWTVGKVVSIKLGRDGTPRRAEVKYHNPGDFFAKVANKAVKGLVKLSNIEDMVEVKKAGINPNKSNQAAVENARRRSKFNSELSSKISQQEVDP